jgi:hypothetical protein
MKAQTLTEQIARIQEMMGLEEQSSNPSYFSRHGEDPMGWGGSDNKNYRDLPTGDYDDETYDDFDTLHTAHPDFHKHYGNDVDHARTMFNTYKEKHGPLNIKRKK